MANLRIKEIANGKVPAKFTIVVGGLTNGYYHDLDETLRRVQHLLDCGGDPARIKIRSEYIEYHDYDIEYDKED